MMLHRHFEALREKGEPEKAEAAQKETQEKPGREEPVEQPKRGRKRKTAE